MKWQPSAVLLLILAVRAAAIDVNPSRQSVPNQFINPPGKRFSIFAGDPERVQKANEVNLKDFQAELLIQPGTLSKTPSTAEQATLAPTEVKVTFKVKNIGKKNYILSFPDAQRYDVAVTEGKDQLIYLWSGDKIFEQTTGKSFVNHGETLTYNCEIPIETLFNNAKSGTYNVKMILANYPEISAEGTLTIKP